MAKVSIIMPFYGSFNNDRLMVSLASIALQKGVEVETIVAETNPVASLAKKLDSEAVRYIHQPDELFVKTGFFRPGFARNLAAKNSSGDIIYNNDGDIVFANPYLIRDLSQNLAKDDKLALRCPLIRRLPVECFEEFMQDFISGGLENALARLDTSQPYVATTSNNPIKMRVFKKFEYGAERVFLYTKPDHDVYKANPDLRGIEPLFSTLGVHAGATLMRKSQFEAIGGYCERFAAWGCHDEDIQWKLAATFNLQPISLEPQLEVLHMDHKRGYFSKEMWERNKAIRREREAKGASIAIQEDVRTYHE